MSNVVQINPTQRVMRTAHRVTFDLVPRPVMEKLFYAAISVGWDADADLYRSETPEAEVELSALQEAVSEASQYTVEVQHEAEEPIPMNERDTLPLAHTPQTCGISHSVAQSCMSALKEAASLASTERFIGLAARQIEESGQPATPERVASHLYQTLQALTATAEQLKASK